MQAWGDKVFHTVIRRTVKFSDSTVAGEPITSYASTSRGRRVLPPAGQGGAAPGVSTREPAGRRRPLPPDRRAARRPSRRRGADARARAPCARPDRPSPRTATAPRRKPSGRVRHDEKMTVYVTSDELLDLEHARLVLRRSPRPGRRPRPAGARGGRAGARRLRGARRRQRAGAAADRGMTPPMTRRRRRRRGRGSPRASRAPRASRCAWTTSRAPSTCC